jgi:hypothetical protein
MSNQFIIVEAVAHDVHVIETRTIPISNKDDSSGDLWVVQFEYHLTLS